MRVRSAVLAASISLVASGCTPIRPFYPKLPAEVSAKPNYVCTDDSVEVVWNLNLPRHQDFCEFPTGGYSGVVACDSNSDCPEGGRCSDGACCASPIPFSECGSSCSPDGVATLTFDPSGGMSTDPRPPRGALSFSPTETTAIALDGEWAPPTTATVRDTARVVVVDAPPLETLPLGFAFQCVGDGWEWTDYDLELAETYPSDRVVVERVVNTSGRHIRLSDGVHPPVLLEARGETTDLNGLLDGTHWSANLTSIGAMGLPLPRCSPLSLADAYPDLSVEVILGCLSDEP